MTERDAIATAIGFLLAALTVSLIVIVAGGCAAAYFWNCFAPDLFGAAKATPRNGIGFVALLVVCTQASSLTVGKSRG